MHFRTELDPLRQAVSKYHWDDQEKKLTIHKRTDVTDIIESNKRQQPLTIDSRFGNQMMHHVAQIPLTIVEQWKREGLDIFDRSPEMRKKLKRKLNDPEWRYLKSTVKKL